MASSSVGDNSLAVDESRLVEKVFTTPSARFSNITPLHARLGRSVFVALDAQLGNQPVAVKCRRCTTELNEKVISHAIVLRQLVHRNIATLYDAFAEDETADVIDSCPQKNLYLVQELVDVDLQTLIASGQVTAGHCRLFTYQLLCGLKFAHSAGIIHWSLKPSNVLINCRDLVLKISDFGLSQFVETASEDGQLSGTLPTVNSSEHWYDAPERLLNTSNLTSAVDIWSAGCLIAEMLMGHSLFKGCNRLDQLLKLIDGVHLSDDDWTCVLRVMPNKLLKNHPFRPRCPLRVQLAGFDRRVVHLLELMLMFNEAERLTADEALLHTYIADYQQHSCSESPTSRTQIVDQVYGDNSAERLLQFAADNDRAAALTSPVLVLPRTRSRSDDIALKNYRNCHNGSPPSSASNDRTPSPNILDLLDKPAKIKNGKGDRHKVDREVSESDGEKDIAEISDEKLHEDLEVGNISVELLRRLCSDTVALPSVLSAHEPQNEVEGNDMQTSPCPVEQQENLISSNELSADPTAAVDGNGKLKKAALGDIPFTYLLDSMDNQAWEDKPIGDCLSLASRAEKCVSKLEFGDKWEQKTESTLQDDCNEDSNKRLSCRNDAPKKKKVPTATLR